MIDRVKARRTFPAPIPVGDQQKLPCSSCSGRVDPLRAARVAIYADRFHYFCSPECRVRFVPSEASPGARSPLDAEGSAVADTSRAMREAAEAEGLAAPAHSRELDTPREAEMLRLAEPRRAWLIGEVGLGALAAALASPVLSSLHLPGWAPVLAAAAACGALSLEKQGRQGRAAMFARIPPLVATLAASCAWAFASADTARAAGLAGVVCAVAAGSRLWIARRQRALQVIERWLDSALGDPQPTDGASVVRPVATIKPGEELVLRAGEQVKVDVVITAGEARVEPWPGSRLRLLRGEGDGLLAGTTVIDGALRAVVRWVGHDRAWARLGVDPARRADRHVAVARLAERLASSGAAALGVAAVAVSLSLDVNVLLALGYGAAVAAALGNVALSELIALMVALGLHRLQVLGICCRSASALDRAGRTSSVVFCDRGTLLSGELSVASIEPSGNVSEAELLGLLAGAYGGIASPIASALSRAAQAQKLRPDATRSPSHLPGLGVTAVASNGQSLVAGTRALLLDRRISVASAETRIGELEALGRSVLLVALDGRWVGLIALQDGLRPGARAATQTLIDAGVEPVLLSGEARETCRALARHIGIEHVRPEVLPQDRAAEIRRLSQAAGMLAVVGSSIDDAALSAAPLSIDIDARGGPLERCDIDIASGDVRDAASAVQLARALQTQTRVALVTATAPLALGLLLSFAGLPLWLLPVLGLSGSVLAARRLEQAP
jgi:Cu+-exporting ATPase